MLCFILITSLNLYGAFPPIFRNLNIVTSIAMKYTDVKIITRYGQILSGNSRFLTSSAYQKAAAKNPGSHFWLSLPFALCLESGMVETRRRGESVKLEMILHVKLTGGVYNSEQRT